jgi:adenylate cyclase
MQPVPTQNRLTSVLRAAGLAVVIGGLAFWLTTGPLARLELAAGDLLFQARGPLPGESQVVLVAIDDASFNSTRLQWPWPRDYLAQIVNAIAIGHPRAIAIDIFFYESTTPEADTALALAIRDAGNVVVVHDIVFHAQDAFQSRKLNRPIPEIEAAAAALGLANFPRDADGAVRCLPAYQSHSDRVLYSWAMQLARLYQGEEDFDLLSGDRVMIGDHPVDLDRGCLLVNYRGPAGSVPYYPAYQVAERTIDPGVFAGKIVIVGATSESLHDNYATPFGSAPPMPGAEINAHAVDTILSQRFIHPLSGVGCLALTVGLTLLSTGAALRLRPLGGLIAVGALMALQAVLAVLLFARDGVLLPVAGPLMATGLTYVGGTGVQFYEEQRRRAYMRSLFERYVAPAVIDAMLSQPENYLSGQRREMTILFSDIRGFTSLAEKLSPGEVVDILNEYLSAMTEVIFQHEGTVDKFEGDAILAFFNAPLTVEDHPTRAVRCAMAMIERLGVMQTRWSATGQYVLEVGIGINTGEAFVGNIGSARRMNYTVIGDAVNLASRLQDLTKEVGIPIVFSEATCEKLPPGAKTRFVINAHVRGRVQPVNVYTIEEL